MPGTPLQPLRFGSYEVVGEPLSRGSYGIVYRAVQGSEEFAVKWLLESAEPNGRQRFENEMWALRQLQHPRLPRFIDCGEKDGLPYFVMTLLPGEPLSKLIDTQQKDFGSQSVAFTMRAAIDILEILVYLRTQEIGHRDIKSAKVLYDAMDHQFYVIDLGLCKSPKSPCRDISFFHVGAPRYSPPGKLISPSRDLPSDDVFAVGVIAYQLLTTRFPWSVPTGDDRDDLIRQMETHSPMPVSQINSMIPWEVAKLVSSFIEVDDAYRPAPASALEQALLVRDGLAVRETAMPPGAFREALSRVIRDPIHGDIRMTDFEWEVMRSREFQRLRWIKQLGFTRYVYPGAEHTRFGHSLGTMHVANRIFRAIEDRVGIWFSDEDTRMVRLYAMLHDIGHLPYGHTLEDELNILQRHDINRGRLSRIFDTKHSELGMLLEKHSYAKAVRQLIESTESGPLDYIKEAVDSAIGSDVLDYINRDAYYCGLDNRVDSAIFRYYSVVNVAMTPHVAARAYGTYGLRYDAEFALEDLFMERFSLFLKVYSHQAKIAAGAMLGRAVSQALAARIISEEELEWMGDTELLVKLKTSGDKGIAELGEALWYRRLYEPVFRARIIRDYNAVLNQAEAAGRFLAEKGLVNPDRRCEYENNLARSAGLNDGEVIIYVPDRAPGVKKIRYYRDRFGKPEVRHKRIPVHLAVEERHLKLWTAYAFIKPDKNYISRRNVADRVAELFQQPNEIDVDPRRGLRV